MNLRAAVEIDFQDMVPKNSTLMERVVKMIPTFHSWMRGKMLGKNKRGLFGGKTVFNILVLWLKSLQDIQVVDVC